MNDQETTTEKLDQIPADTPFSLYQHFDKNLYRIINPDGTSVNETLRKLFLSNSDISPTTIGDGVITGTLDIQENAILGGKKSFDNTQAGFILGSNKGTYQFYIGNSLNYLNWDGSTLTIAGNITATTGMIGGFTIGATTITATNLTLTSGGANVANIIVGSGANSGGINSAAAGSDIVFWSGATFANRATAPFRVDAAGNLTATSATISGYLISQQGTFGGDGSDGALSISSGTTTIDLANAATVVKNYSSISITGTAKLTFINPHANGTLIIIKSQGNVTLTSNQPDIDVSGMGAKGGSAQTDGNNNTNYILDTTNHQGLGNTTGAGGTKLGGVIYGNLFLYTASNANLIQRKCIFITPGAGGGGGGNAGSGEAGGAGGAGGGALYLECAGALNFTGSINANGVSGGNGGNSASQGGGGGGGGGAQGMVIVLYKTLTSASGTINATGGNGGQGGTGINAGSSGGGGSGAGSYGGAGGSGPGGNGGSTPGGNGGGPGAGGGGSNGGGPGGTSPAVGGTGGATSNTFVAKNTAFA